MGSKVPRKENKNAPRTPIKDKRKAKQEKKAQHAR